MCFAQAFVNHAVYFEIVLAIAVIDSDHFAHRVRVAKQLESRGRWMKVLSSTGSAKILGVFLP